MIIRSAIVLAIVLSCLRSDAQEKDSLYYPTDRLTEIEIISAVLRDTISQIPMSLSRLDPRDYISEIGNSSLAALNSVPGVYIQSGALNTNRITIRGIGSRNPYSTNRIKAYFSGIPLTSAEGTTELDDIPKDIIAAIEVLNGGRSSFYGAGLGGMILLEPGVQGTDGFSALVNTGIGSYGTREFSATLSRGDLKSRSILSVSSFNSAGWRNNSAYERLNLFGFHKLELGKHSMELLINSRSYSAEIPSSLSLEDFNESPRNAASNWEAVNGRESNRKLLLALKADLQLNSMLRSEIAVFYNNYSGDEYRPFNDLFDSSHSFGLRSINSYSRESFKLQFLIEAMHESYAWNIVNLDQWTLLSDYDETRIPIHIALMSSFELSDDLILDAGLSLNQLSYDLKDVLNNASKESYRYPTEWSPFVGLSYSMSRSFSLFSSISHGFSYPSVQETLLPEGIKNNELKAESGFTEEFGIRYSSKSKNWNAGLSLFLMQVDDVLLTERLDNGDSYGKNGGLVNNTGIEFSVNGDIVASKGSRSASLSLTNNLSYGNYKFGRFVDSGIDYSGNYLPGLPEFSNYMSLRYSRSSYSVQLNHQYYSRQFLDDANAEVLGSYSLVNYQMNYNYSIGEIKGRLGFQINNLFDAAYASMVVVNAPSFGSNPARYYYPGFKRNFMIRLTIQVE